MEGSKLKVSDALSQLYSEEKHKISDVIPLNFLLHFTDYQMNKECDHLASKLYAHKKPKLTTKGIDIVMIGKRNISLSKDMNHQKPQRKAIMQQLWLKLMNANMLTPYRKFR